MIFCLSFEKCMRSIVITTASLAFVSHALAYKLFTGPDGRQVITSECKGSQDGCYQEASTLCKGPYQVVGSHSRAGGLIIDFGMPGPATYYSMSYKCGASDGRLASFPRRGPEWNPPRPAYVNCDVNPNNVQCYGYR
jgi:hypothetical protein